MPENLILDHTRDYLNGLCALQDLESWVLSNLQRILDSGDKKAIAIANEIDADLVELGEGLIDEMALRDYLQRIISKYVGEAGKSVHPTEGLSREALCQPNHGLSLDASKPCTRGVR